MPKRPPAARRWSVAQARAALAALASSGLRAGLFAARAGFDVQWLHTWRRKFATAPEQTSTRPDSSSSAHAPSSESG